jgi:hypothetical protein
MSPWDLPLPRPPRPTYPLYPELIQAWASFSYPPGQTIPPEQFYKRQSSRPNLQIDEIIDSRNVGRGTEYLTRFHSVAQPVSTKESKLKTDENKETIRFYRNKREIEIKGQ